MTTKTPTQSPAMTLLQLVWDNIHDPCVFAHSWERINAAMQDALTLAIVRGFRFDVEDWKAMERFDPGYWRHTEDCYSLACSGTYRGSRSHGVNTSACHAIEHYLGRQPFLLQVGVCGDWGFRPTGDTRTRLHVGAQFPWFSVRDDKWLAVTVTSFAEDQQSLTACSYKARSGRDDYRNKVERRIRITHDDIAEYHKTLREDKRQS